MSSLITSYTAQVVSSIGSYVPPLPRYSMSTHRVTREWGKVGFLQSLIYIIMVAIYVMVYLTYFLLPHSPPYGTCILWQTNYFISAATVVYREFNTNTY